MMATTQLWSFAKFFAKATALSRFSSVTLSATSASTPFVVPLPSASVLISEIFPRMTVNGIFSISPTAVEVRKWLAPAPTGSSRILWPSEAAFAPARYMPSMLVLCSVPMLMFRPPQMEVISSTSSGSSDMIGLAPHASRILATSFTVT